MEKRYFKTFLFLVGCFVLLHLLHVVQAQDVLPPYRQSEAVINSSENSPDSEQDLDTDENEYDDQEENEDGDDYEDEDDEDEWDDAEDNGDQDDTDDFEDGSSEVDIEQDSTKDTELPKASVPSPKTPEASPTTAAEPAQKAKSAVQTVGPIERAEVINGPVKEEDLSYQVGKDNIIFNFKNAQLKNLMDWMEKIHGVTFVPDDVIKGGSKQPGFNLDDPNFKISFKTEKPLSKQEAWSLFTTFLDLANLALVPMPEKNFFRVVQVKNSQTMALPVYVGIDPQNLPNNDMRIRYIYFLQNTTPDQVKPFLDKLKIMTVDYFRELKAIIFTDKSFKVKSAMKIISELDKASMPEVLKVIPLMRADVHDVVELYNKIAQKETPQAQMFGAKKEPSLFYFPKDVALFEEKRTNALIVLGPKDAVGRVEVFVRQFIDKDVGMRYSPLHKITLNYTSAQQMADILNKVTSFDSDSDAAKYGGVRAGEKYFKKMIFVAEESSNQLLVNATEEDFVHIKKIVGQLDTKQRQVAIEVLIVSVDVQNNKELGTHLRNKNDVLLGKHVDFQTSGMKVSPGNYTSVLVDQATNSLMANLIKLAQGHVPGTTLFSFGSGTNVWALLKMLQTFSRTNVLSNPFLIATNKYQASVSTGETKRVVNTEVVGGGDAKSTGKGDLSANLEVKVMPRISDPEVGNLINLQIEVSITDFLAEQTTSSVYPRSTKQVITNANIANKEVLALGGLMREVEEEKESSVPVLGRIPLVGWLFKYKTQQKRTENLLIFISPRVIEAGSREARDYTENKSNDAINFSEATHRYGSDKRSPVHRWFFHDNEKTATTRGIEKFVREEKKIAHQEEKREEKAKKREKKAKLAAVKRPSLTSYMPEQEVVA